MKTAEEYMRQINPNGLIGFENSLVIMIEDVADPDNRIYRLEYLATPDASKAIAYCRFNPWGKGGLPSAGESYSEGHVAEDGLLCLGSGTVSSVWDSPYELEFTIARARYWCTGFSVFKETGAFPNP